MIGHCVPAALATCLAAHLAALSVPAAAQTRKGMKLSEVPFTQVTIADRFWKPRRDTNRKVSLKHSLDQLEKTNNLRNFDLAAQGKREGYSGPVFMDSDLYKTLEAVAYSLATDPDPALEARIDGMIARIAAAQRPNGYLNTWYEVNAPDQTFTNLRDNHELYCAGHLFEAAVAHVQATGKRTLLTIATKYADHLVATFGDGPGKRPGYCGHPEIELALVKLWRATGNKAYFDLAAYFVNARGSHFFAVEHRTPDAEYDGAYFQDDVPIREHKNIKGHAVRAAYLMSGVVDVAAETGDQGLLDMVNRVWRNTSRKNTYITGGIGPSAHNEGFTADYDLPNLTAYQETCASVALALWNHRMNLLTGDAKYADIVETSLYNGVLDGVSVDGKRFFYVNPLESMGTHHRSDWFGCACCPPNVARTLSSLGGYAYATDADGLTVNLYVQGGVNTKIGSGAVKVDVKTDYPWDGKVTLTLKPEAPRTFSLRLRIPAWCEKWSISAGAPTRWPMENGYVVVRKQWKPGDVVTLTLDMPARRVEANPNVTANRGLAAVQRGPLVYCLEAVDQKAPVADLYLPMEALLQPKERPDLFGGITTLEGTAYTAGQSEWGPRLYQSARKPRPTHVTAIPYAFWDNREAGAMRVWVPLAPGAPTAGGPETAAKVTLSYVSGNAQPRGINDGIEPKSSGEQPAALCHWWPHKGGSEWAQYTWSNPVRVNGVRVYWFDDTGRGECRLPAGWLVEALQADGTWTVVKAAEFPVAKDRWTEVRFPTVATKSLRLTVRLQEGWAGGVHEWKILEDED